MIRPVKATAAAVSAALCVLAATATDAHHSTVMFDISTPVSVGGTVVRFEQVAPHSYIVVQQATDSGPVEWAIEGPAPNQLVRRHLDDAVRPGDTIVACGYVLKRPPTGSPRTLLVAEVVVMPDGKARIWSPYGNEHCRENNVYDLAEQ